VREFRVAELSNSQRHGGCDQRRRRDAANRTEPKGH